LLPYLVEQSCQEAVIIGSAYSNHVLGITQLLIENNIQPTLFVLGNADDKRQGNLLLTSLLVPDSQIHWIARKDWTHVEIKAAEYAQGNSKKTIVIPEGAYMPAALSGALTLSLDILENEKQLQEDFQHIFIDAGTGLMAIAVILAFAWLRKKAQIHVLLLADTKDEFKRKLQEFQLSFEQLVKDKLDEQVVSNQFKLHLPTQAASFGSINTTVFQTIKEIARSEGFFTDPIYSAKLFFEAKKIIQENFLGGNILIIHSGGALTLAGFQEQLSKEVILHRLD